jgi:hypothetical protein
MTWKKVANTYRYFARSCDRRIERARIILEHVEGKPTYEAAEYLMTACPSLLKKLRMREPLTSYEKEKLVAHAVEHYSKALSDNLALRMIANAAVHLAERQAYIKETATAADIPSDTEYYRALREYEERAVKCVSDAELF